MDIVFFGTPTFATSTLKSLIEDPQFNVKTVVTQPDKPIGRKQTITPPPVKKLALEHQIPVLQPKNKQELLEITSKLEADFFIVIAYGMLFPTATLQKPKTACLNIHLSILPKYRGASPVQQALLNGDKKTGISIIEMENKMDYGKLYHIEELTITPEDNLEILSERIGQLSGKHICKILKQINNKELIPTEQDHPNATYCKKINKEDGKINWNQTASQIHNQIRAYTPWPSTFTEWQGKKIKIISAEKDNSQNPIGQFTLAEKQIKIGTKDGSILPKTIQIPGKKPMQIKDFINGHQQQLKQ